MRNDRSTLAEFVARQISQAIIGGVFVHLAGGVVEDLFDEFADGEAVIQCHHPDVNQLCGAFADDANSEQFFVAGSEYNFQ